MLNDCYECKNREPGCQDGCLKFLSHSLTNIEQKEAIRKGRTKESNYYNYVKAANKNMKKGKKHRRV